MDAGIAIRAAVTADAGVIAAIYAPHALAGTATFEDDAPAPATMAERMAAGDGLHPWLVATIAGEVVGYAYAAPFHTRRGYRWTVETTVYVADTAQRRGVGRRLYTALIETLTAQGFRQAVARVALPNPGSVALHEAAGFTSIGVQPAIGYKHGQWIAVGLWQRPLADLGDPPVEPRRFAQAGRP
jgi:phosphinothricin acetyltransferase